MRLIDADKLEVISYTNTEERDDTFDAGAQWLAELIDEQPTVDTVPVVRCKDCAYFGTNDENVPYCFNRFGLNEPEPNGFCNYGAKKYE